jgi:methionyl-tRNA formyltransferase
MITRIVFMGSPDFAARPLRVLAQAYSVVGVVTQPDRPAGRGNALTLPPVKVAALELGIPVIQPEKLRQPEAMQQLRAWNPDLVVVVAFGQILKPEVLDLPRFGCINIHASLLPRWRGAAPIQAAIAAGDAYAGVTIMKMDPGVDTGPMLSWRAIPILPDDTGGFLFEKLSGLGVDLLMETLPPYLAGELQPQPQPAEGSTYAPMLKKEDGLLDFSRPAVELERKIRAYAPWPGAFLPWQGAALKIHKARVEKGRLEPGRKEIVGGFPAIGTAGDILVLEVVQPAGKKPMPGKAFLAGARNWVGA